MKEDKKVPQLRFPEFTDAWKQRELGEIAERVTRRNSSLESQTPLTISAEYGLIDQNKFFGKRIAAKDLSNYYLIQKGEFAYNKSTSNDAPWGAIKRLDCYNNGALSTLYIVFKIKDNKSCYSDFLVTYYGTSLWHKGVKEIATEGARNHGLLNVSPSDFFRTKLVIPQDFEEQRKIGAFFTQLDNTITLQQRKLNSLQKLKKGLLQKMFPKKGENIPEIRFPEFSDAWKQRKFGDFAKVSMCKRIFKEETTQTGDVPFFKIGTFGGIPDAFISRYKFESYKAKYPYPKKGDILISASGSIGRIVEYSGKDEYFQDSNIIWLDHDESVLNSFLKHVYSIIKWNGIEGTTIKRLYNDNVLTTKILTPSLEEQSKIGIFFTQLDNTITLQQRWHFYSQKRS